MQHARNRFTLLTMLVLLAGLLPAAPVVYAGTITVTTTAASGAGSLDAAIDTANSTAGDDTILFNIPANLAQPEGYWRIDVSASPLSALTDAGTFIDGRSQPGSTISIPKIEIRGASTTQASGFTLLSARNTVRGFIINGFDKATSCSGVRGDCGAGITISGTGATNNAVYGNFVGTNYNGTTAIRNGQAGIAIINGASNNTIGVVGDGNVVSGNGNTGSLNGQILIGNTDPTPGQNMSGNVVTGNYIGLAADGRTALPGGYHGVFLTFNALSNTIGPSNYIAGNGSGTSFRSYGIFIGSSVTENAVQNNRVVGNFIGLNIDGNAVPNRNGGIRLTQNTQTTTIGTNNIIGGPNAADRNYIAGNNENGILIDSICRNTPSISNVVQNNAIGFNAAGVAKPNALAGIQLSDNVDLGSATDPGTCNNQIGPGNTISSNGTDGILLRGVSAASPTTGNRIVGNTISTNTANGVRIQSGASANTVGAASQGNTISANGSFGVLIESSPNNLVSSNNIDGHTNGVGVVIQSAASTGNTVNFNFVGSGSANTVGIRITNAATGNAINGNIADNNRQYGIEITGAGTNNNTVSQNAVRNNGNFGSGGLHGILVTNGTGNRISQTYTTGNGGASGKGISLGSGASAGNAGRPAPTLNLNGSTLSGTSNCGANCLIELFTGNSAEASEGNSYIATSEIRTDASGSFSVQLPLPGCQPFIVATITDGSNNTSEFSNTVGPSPSCQAAAPAIELTKETADVGNATPGSVIEYVHFLRNTGTAEGSFTISFSSSAGWGVLVPTTASYIIGANSQVEIRVRVTVPGGASAGNSDTSTIQATLTNTGASVSRSDVTTVAQSYNFSFTPPALSSPSPVPPGQSITYNHTITNLGNGPDTFSVVLSSPPPAGITVNINASGCVDVAPNATCSVAVTVNVVNGTAPASYVATIVATSEDGVTTRQVVDTTQIQQVAVPVISPATLSVSGKPGQTVQLVHQLSNQGGIEGTFSVQASGLSAQAQTDGWLISINPNTPITLAPTASRTITVSVTIPAYTPGKPTTFQGHQEAIRVDVPASGNNPAAVPANDTVTVLLQPALTFTPDVSSNAAPNQVINLPHTLSNTGNGQESFDFSFQLPPAPAGWSAQVIDPSTGLPISSITLARAVTKNLLVRITVPTGVTLAQSYNVVTTATARSDSNVKASVTDTLTIVSAAVPVLNGPLTGNADPGAPVTLNHTIQNIGTSAGSFQMSFEGLPTGWTATATPNPTSSLAPNAAPTNLAVQITPDGNALAGVYQITVRATAQDANAATTSVIDTITVQQRAELVLAPVSYNTENNPGTVVTYTHTLTNEGNFTDTITLAASGTQPWAQNVSPTSLQLAAGASAQLQLTVSIPPGVVAGLQNVAIITATSSLPAVTAKATDTTTVAAVPGLTLTPAVFTNAGEATKPVTFTFTLFNSGSVTQDYDLSATPPTGWTATLLSGAVVTGLAPGATAQITLVVSAPDGTPNNTTDDTILLVTSRSAPNPSAQAIARLLVGPAFSVLIDPDRTQQAVPGQVVNYSHVVTNTGLFTDTYVLETSSLLGWDTSVAPASISLAPGATAQVTVTVAVPSGALAEEAERTRVVVTSTSRADATDFADDVTTVQQVARVEISPRFITFTELGAEVTLIHLVQNVGNGADSFVITATSSLNWPVSLSTAQTPSLGVGSAYQITLRARVPANAELGLISEITVRATSRFDATAYDETEDLLGGPPKPIEGGGGIIVPGAEQRQYIPLVAK